MKIIAQLFTVRELLKDKSYDQVKEVLTTIKDQGYEGVQISGIGAVTKEIADMYEEICADLGLDIGATHTSIEALREDLQWIVDYHKQWNCKYVGIGSMPDAYRSPDKVAEFANECNEVGKALAAEGLTLVYHNHRFEFEKSQAGTMMDVLYDVFDPAYVQFELDTYWVQAGGCNPESWIRKVADRMDVVHYKDFRIVKDEQQFAEVGQGNLDWPAIALACKETNVLYAAVEQDAFTDDPLKSLGMSMAYLKEQELC